MRSNSKVRKRTCALRRKGAALAESAAALVLLLPIVITIIFAILEMSYAYAIKTCMSEGARQAARQLSIAYAQDATVAADRSRQDTRAFDNIRIRNMINDSRQFDDATFQTAADPPVVTVRVRYTSGQYNLPVFPNPDPLNLGSTFSISGTSTYRLQ